MALEFDGVNDKVDHGDIDELDAPTAFSVAFWLNYDTISINDGFVHKRSATTNGFMIGPRIAGGDFGCSISTGTDQHGRVVGGITADTWEHWAVVFNGAGVGNAARLKIYKNGIEQTLTFTGTIPAAVTTSTTATLQMMTNPPGSLFADGALQFMRIWNAAITETEVHAERFATSAVRTANLLLDAPYTDGTTAEDFSGQGHDGTVTGALQITGPEWFEVLGAGSYVITGQDAALNTGAAIAALSGSYVITGSSVALVASLRIPQLYLLYSGPVYETRLEVIPL